ncbi:NAD(P)/FAD-dependent oxidoreductase [Blastococcus sp. TML/M2B]|uniref:NAD(P)/FAD-dependent oxidoreductase n=1 Tax=unclassified Blastococcus TaxID=2619396 RepID=UPI00190BE5E1|nr:MULTISPECIES: NAD(P)/FAD-dependent oxidoreductase [unclassified Blastococcus]MBN1092590.1 NAD(P)/FAD-dependent oxidoreductase [Blastococcus sp. TML/M2B]MBN1097317.1 NAD(P)/FAD-dependent oxidoreductase [Blastococcus sp. TML/C7B]
MDERYDVVVIGGGAAGLSGALTLARARRSVLVVDAGEPRNAPAGHVHGYLGREGTPPAELLATGRDEVTGYGGTVRPGRVTGLGREDDGFRVDLADGGPVRARRLLLATGLVDELPDLPGVAERWGSTVVHCPYCHGWEVRDRAVGIVSTGSMGVHAATLWRQWTDDVVLFVHTGAEPTAAELQRLAARGVRVVRARVQGLEGGADVRLADGELVARDAVVVTTRMVGTAELVTGLGATPAPMEVNGAVVGSYLPADPTGRTDVPGVWVAGNAGDLSAQVVVAAAQGLRAGAMINADLIEEDTARAVAARRSAA